MYVYLEAFLLHYRNLIRIFSGENHRRDDLSTADARAWSGREMTPEETAAIRAPAGPSIPSTSSRFPNTCSIALSCAMTMIADGTSTQCSPKSARSLLRLKGPFPRKPGQLPHATLLPGVWTTIEHGSVRLSTL